MLRKIGAPLLVCLAVTAQADAGLFDCFCHDEPDCAAPVYCEPMCCEPVDVAPTCAAPMTDCCGGWGSGYGGYGADCYEYCPPPEDGCCLVRFFRHLCHDDDEYYCPPQYCPPQYCPPQYCGEQYPMGHYGYGH
jgi:hypothetical protein